jgi:pSer/pThr/pTyr-binding forkhead associated (FHA) protein
VCALDQAGNVGHDEGVIASLHHAEVRLEGGKRVVGDFGSGGGQARNESRFASIGKAHQADVGQQLQLQFNLENLARLALLVLRGCLMSGSSEARITSAASAAFGRNPKIAR